MRRALLLSLLLLVGCGGDGGGGGGGPQARVDAAVKASEGSDSYRMALRMESDFGDQEIEMRGEIVSAADQSRGYFKGEIGLDGQEPGPMEFIQLREEQFVRGEQFMPAIPAGKRWLHLDEPATPTMTPPEFLEFLRDSPDIEEVGSEDVRGEPTLHLRGPLDMKELVRDTSSQAARQFAAIPQAGELKVTVDVLIAERDDRLRRMAMRMTHPDAPGEMKIDADILEYDVPLDAAQAPPAGEVAEPEEIGG